MKKKAMEQMLEINGKLLADAAFVKMGNEVTKLIMKPVEGQLPKELLPLVNSPFGQLLAAFGVSFVAEQYNMSGLDSVARAVNAAATTSCVNAVMSMAEKCLTREAEVLGAPVHTPAALPQAVRNMSKGGQNAAKFTDGKPSGILGIIAKSAEIARNTASGNENVIDAEVVEVYWPTDRKELKLDDKNLCVCPNPIEGKEAHSKQRDKFQPWNSKSVNGYRSDLDKLLICGGCRVDLETQYGKEKAKLAEEKKKAELESKLEAYTKDYEDCLAKITKAESSVATFMGLVQGELDNENYTESLKNAQEKVAKLNALKTELETKTLALEEQLTSTPAKPAANTTTGNVKTQPQQQTNAKPPTGAAARIKNGK